MPIIRGKYPIAQRPVPQANSAMGFGELSMLIMQLQQLKNDLINTTNAKLAEVDTKLKEHIQTILDSTQVLKNTQNAVVDYAQRVKQGAPGKNADEESILKRLQAKIPPQVDTKELEASILAKVPKIDTQALTRQVLKQIPENKASLKIIQEKFEIDPMSVIEKIMELSRQGKFKLKKENIDGLEQTMSAFQSQLGRGYLHGGGDTVKAGTNVTITIDSSGKKVINSTGGSGFTVLNTASTVNGSNQTFVFSTATAQPTFIVSDGIYFTALDSNGNTQWSWNAGTKTATLTIPPPINSIFAIA